MKQKRFLIVSMGPSVIVADTFNGKEFCVFEEYEGGMPAAYRASFTVEALNLKWEAERDALRRNLINFEEPSP